MKVQTKQLQNDTELTEEQTHEVTVSEEYGANAGPQGTSSDLRDSDTCSKKKRKTLQMEFMLSSFPGEILVPWKYGVEYSSMKMSSTWW